MTDRRRSRRAQRLLCGLWPLCLVALSTARGGELELRFTQALSAEAFPQRVTIEGHAARIRVEDANSSWSCCLDFAPEVRIDGRTIQVTEVDQEEPCLCPEVLWVLEVELLGVEPGAWDLVVRSRFLDRPDRVIASARVDVPATDTAVFLRGEANGDGVIDLSDAVAILTSLFLGGPAPACRDAIDVNDDGAADLSDPVSLLGHLFLGGPAPAAPFPEPGEDPTADDTFDCRLGTRLVSVTRFVRNGDIDADGAVDMADAVRLLAYISGEKTELPCADAADVDDDGAITLADYCAICPDCCPAPVAAEAGPGVGPTQPCVTDETPDKLGCTVSHCAQ